MEKRRDRGEHRYASEVSEASSKQESSSLRGSIVALLVAAILAAFGPQILEAAIPAGALGREEHERIELGPRTLGQVRRVAELNLVRARAVAAGSRRIASERIGPVPDSWIEVFMIIPGEVVAGVDLSGLGMEDVSISEDQRGRQQACITLPRPEVMYVTINYEEIVTRSDESMWIGTNDALLSIKADLEAEAQQRLSQSAVESGVLERAEAIAAASISDVLYDLGFTDVDVRFVEEEEVDEVEQEGAEASKEVI